MREAVEGPDAGAVVLFFGTVRNNTDGRAVKHLEYESYPPMAKKKMAEIAQEDFGEMGDRSRGYDSPRWEVGDRPR